LKQPAIKTTKPWWKIRIEQHKSPTPRQPQNEARISGLYYINP